MLENISLRRKQNKLGEKKKDIEYAIAKRLNRLFKQFIYRFQNEVEVYFEYIKFCRAVGFDSAISGIIGQMLQVKSINSYWYIDFHISFHCCPTTGKRPLPGSSTSVTRQQSPTSRLKNDLVYTTISASNCRTSDGHFAALSD